MINEQINKRLHEIIGICFHTSISGGICGKCHRLALRADFLNWEGFGILWEFMQKHERWEEFLIELWRDKNKVVLPDAVEKVMQHDMGEIYVSYISPPALARAVVEFFGKKITKT